MLITIWDGLKFRQVDKATADALIAQDKAEIPTGSAVKYRSQFTGYNNRAMATEVSKTQAEKPPRKRGRPRKNPIE